MNGILRMLAVLFLGTQTTNNATTQIRDTNEENELGKTKNLYFTFILGGNLYKVGVEKEW